MSKKKIIIFFCVILALTKMVIGQDRTFLFTVTPQKSTAGHFLVHYDAGYAERAFQQFGEEGIEQRAGVQAAVGRGFTLLALSSLAVDGGNSHASYQAEMLIDVFSQKSKPLNLAAGVGFLHEYIGVDVIVGRIIAGRDFAKWKMHGNLILEKPLSRLRDKVDVITTFGFSRSVSRSLRLGVEAIAEDLEGFWEEEEAEGGAKLLIGPSLHVASEKSRWQFTIGGGPIFYVTKSNRDSGAPRALPNVPGETGFSVRSSLSYGL